MPEAFARSEIQREDTAVTRLVFAALLVGQCRAENLVSAHGQVQRGAWRLESPEQLALAAIHAHDGLAAAAYQEVVANAEIRPRSLEFVGKVDLSGCFARGRIEDVEARSVAEVNGVVGRDKLSSC